MRGKVGRREGEEKVREVGDEREGGDERSGRESEGGG